MKKKLETFRVWHRTKYGTGIEKIKAENKTDARSRFIKLRPQFKDSIIEIDKP
jgi:hypothetical protein